jgi:hypothetical protein
MASSTKRSDVKKDSRSRRKHGENIEKNNILLSYPIIVLFVQFTLELNAPHTSSSPPSTIGDQ